MNLVPVINRWKVLLPFLVLVAALVLTGCGPAAISDGSGDARVNAESQETVLQLPVDESEDSASSNAGESANPSVQLPSQTLVDRQGAVEVAVTPQAEATLQSGRLVFEVSMNTHSVDLSMDLAELAELVTDTDITLTAASWSGGSGHHVTGYLEFELPQGDASSRFAEAKNWVLTIRGVDANQRVFIWDIG